MYNNNKHKKHIVIQKIVAWPKASVFRILLVLERNSNTRITIFYSLRNSQRRFIFIYFLLRVFLGLKCIKRALTLKQQTTSRPERKIRHNYHPSHTPNHLPPFNFGSPGRMAPLAGAPKNPVTPFPPSNPDLLRDDSYPLAPWFEWSTPLSRQTVSMATKETGFF